MAIDTMAVLEDVSWKAGIKWAIATGIGGLIIGLPLVALATAMGKASAPSELRAGPGGVELAAPIKGRYEAAAEE